MAVADQHKPACGHCDNSSPIGVGLMSKNIFRVKYL
jgi:hypothetical protein